MLAAAAVATAAPSFHSLRTRDHFSSSCSRSHHSSDADASSLFCAHFRMPTARPSPMRPNSSSDPMDFALTPLASYSSPQDGDRSDAADEEGPGLDFISGGDVDEVDEAGDGFELVIEKNKKNRRRIRSRIQIDADLETVWSVLTNYEGLADFVPSLAVSRLLDKRDKFARVYQVGRQELALGFKFDAKGVIDCYERDLEVLPKGGRRRDIDFEMVKGDFEIFQGKWSIEQIDYDFEDEDSTRKEFQTTLIYVVELQPKLWLPVSLIQGRVCREVKNNLFSVRDEAQRIQGLKASKLTA